MRLQPWLLAAANVLISSPCLAEDIDLTSRPAHARFGYERVELPGGERMGLVGTSYLVDWSDLGWSVGPAVYGGVSGQRGGFLTLGGELAWRRRIAGPVGVEFGLYAGGGGGGSAPQGGGLMLRPHADLWWAVGPGSVGISASQVRFPNGSIDSTQFGLVWSVDSTFRYVPFYAPGLQVAGNGRAGIGFDRVVAVAGAYRPQSGHTLLNGAALPATIGTVGARAEQDWNAHSFWGLEVNGAASGGVAGYAEYLATVGVQAALVPGRLSASGRVALGMGGGGGVSVGGGLLTKASAGLTLQVARDLALALELGLVDAPHGNWHATQGAVAWVWTLDRATAGPATESPVTRTEFGGGVESFRAARRDGSTRKLTADVLKVDRFVSSNVYLSAQAHSAIAGDAGGYTAGFFGLGWYGQLGPYLHATAELLAGSAGGGSVDTSGGLLLQPMVSVGVRLGPSLALELGTGRVKSLHGRLSGQVVAASLVYAYGVTGTGR